MVDPSTWPIIGVDDHLPAVPAARLAPQALRSRFSEPPSWQPDLLADRLHLAATARPAAVLMPIVQHPHQPTMLLTRRTAHLRRHSGQVAFPGGRRDEEDESPRATALREAWEEVGLDPTQVEVIGQMPEYITGTGFRVTPVVGLIAPGLALKPDPEEVADVFEVPLEFLMNPRHHQRRRILMDDEERHFFAMPWRAPDSESDYFIWGATAAMLRNLYRLLSA
jgi:8-oxo-dGTP pyrophosphatase MutT (NUDIX family)